ncbi:MAG: helix-turn-helix domain-containing protein [candidate division NC10 bacterium]|nr:helix-turn-helix domain-containing protein [candidate division NC10 bacterium]
MSERATVGSILRERREAKGLTRDQAAEAARIKPVFLQAMEEDDYRFLPDELYVVRFLHEYAAFLGLDATAIRSQFVRQTSHAQAAGTAGLGVKEPVRISLRRLLPVALVLLAAVPVIVIGYSLYTQGGKPAPTPPRPVVAPRAPAAPTEGAAPAPAAPREIQASSAAPREMPAIPAPGPEGHLLRVQATDVTWLTVTIDGREVRDVLLQPGDTVQWRARERYLITVGNAGGIHLILNGQALPPIGRPGQVLRNVPIPPASEAVSR